MTSCGQEPVLYGGRDILEQNFAYSISLEGLHPALFQIRPGRLQGHVQPLGFSPAEAIDHRLGCVVDPHLLLHDAIGFDALAETGTGKEDGPDRSSICL
jgi:hypothetical protein